MTEPKKKEKKVTPRFYNWVLTKNLKKEEQHLEEVWKQEYLDGMHKMPENKMMYCIWTLEKVENLHFHFYVEFTEKVSMKHIKEVFGCNYIDCEPRKGSQQDAIDYIKKQGKFKEDKSSKVFNNKPWIEIGDKKHQGNRSDLDSMVDMMEDGYMPNDILRTFRGNALRHMNMIISGTKALYKCTDIDKALDHMTLSDRRNYLNKNTKSA